MLATDLPLRLTFPFHRRALEQLLAEADQAPRGERHDSRSVGLYAIEAVSPVNGAWPGLPRRSVHLRSVHLQGSSLLPHFTGAGFLYSPTNVPYTGNFVNKGDVTWIEPVPLGDGWYAYVLICND
jgi:hypothetical protein